MANTLQEARDAISALVRTAWAATAPSAPLAYDNVKSATTIPPPAGTTWAKLNIRFLDGYNAALGASMFRRFGVVSIQVFVPEGSGMEVSDGHAQALLNALQVPGAAGNVWFRNVKPRDVGPDGAWHMTIVQADFQFDQVA